MTMAVRPAAETERVAGSGREEDVNVGRRPAQAPSVESACSIQIEVLIGMGLPANLGAALGMGSILGRPRPRLR